MKFELPELPYDYDALAPHISGRTVELHYEKHHKGYMRKLEKGVADSSLADETLENIMRSSNGSVFNNAAQVWNHSFYWLSMTPDDQEGPTGALAEALARDLGGIEGFKEKFAAIARGEFGSGWAWLVARPDRTLEVLSTTDAENPLAADKRPLLTLDVWEHAYYLDYQNERGRYVASFLDHLLNWRFAERNFEGTG